MERQGRYQPDKREHGEVFESFPGLNLLRGNNDVERVDFEVIDRQLHVEIESRDGYRLDYLLRAPREDDFDSVQNYRAVMWAEMLMVERMIVARDGVEVNITEEMKNISRRRMPLCIDIQTRHLQIRPESILVTGNSESDYITRNLYYYGSASALIDAKCNGYVQMALPVSDFSLCVLAHEWGHLFDIKSLKQRIADKDRASFINSLKADTDSTNMNILASSWNGLLKLFIDEEKMNRQAELNISKCERNAHAIGLRMLRDLAKRLDLKKSSLQRFAYTSESALAGYEKGRVYSDDSRAVACRKPDKHWETIATTTKSVQDAYDEVYGTTISPRNTH